jgi:hypothetical protein
MMRQLILTAKFRRSFRKFVKRDSKLQNRIETTLIQMQQDVFAVTFVEISIDWKRDIDSASENLTDSQNWAIVFYIPDSKTHPSPKPHIQSIAVHSADPQWCNRKKHTHSHPNRPPDTLTHSHLASAPKTHNPSVVPQQNCDQTATDLPSAPPSTKKYPQPPQKIQSHPTLKTV